MIYRYISGFYYLIMKNLILLNSIFDSRTKFFYLVRKVSKFFIIIRKFAIFQKLHLEGDLLILRVHLAYCLTNVVLTYLGNNFC